MIVFANLFKYYSPIAMDKLNINPLKKHFKSGKSFETKDIVAFYKRQEADIKQTAVNWRVYSLIQMGLLNSNGRGKFMMGDGKNPIRKHFSIGIRASNYPYKRNRW